MKLNNSLKNFITENQNALKIVCLFLGFVVLTQAVGQVSFIKNRERLQEFNPWQPAHTNFNVPLFARWDSGWYVSIVKENYVLKDNQNSNVAFLPLYPLLIKLVSSVTSIGYFYSGQLVAWAACLFLLFIFRKLLRLDFNESLAFKIIVLMLVYPWSFFLGAVYAESLFLCLVISAFYLARKRLWWAAGLLGFLAALTKISGIFLLPAMLWEFFNSERKFSVKALWLLLIPAGLASFMGYLKYQTGDFFAFAHNQSTYLRHLAFPFSGVWTDLQRTLEFFLQGAYVNALVYGLTIFFLFLAIGLLIKFRKDLRPSYLIFASLSLLLPLSTGTTTSLGRYLLVIFPIFIAAGLIKHKWFERAWLVISPIFLAAFVYFFVAWYFVV